MNEKEIIVVLTYAIPIITFISLLIGYKIGYSAGKKEMEEKVKKHNSFFSKW